MEPGQALVSGSLQNTGNMPATVLSGNGYLLEIKGGEAVVVYSVIGECKEQCRRIVYDEPSSPWLPYYNHYHYVIDNKCMCCCWANSQPASPVWPTTLPNCPCQVSFDEDGNPFDEDGNPLDNNWNLDNPADQDYHPGASFCIRSACSAVVGGGPSQQCCYDKSGNLITDGGAAGTPDSIAPCGPLDWWDHMEQDVYPFDYCAAAGMLNCYLLHRTPNNGKNCTCNPPGHHNCNHQVTAYICDCN